MKTGNSWLEQSEEIREKKKINIKVLDTVIEERQIKRGEQLGNWKTKKSGGDCGERIETKKKERGKVEIVSSGF